MRMSLNQAAEAMGALLVGPHQDVDILGASMDSRTVQPGDLFFCLPGNRVDGHGYASQALAAGAVAVVAVRPIDGLTDQVPVLIVRDAVQALGDLARAWRFATKARVVGITGSAGKTTVKEMLARICSLAGSTCRNHLNWNNQIGLPLSLMSCTGQESFWIMEAGISRPGDMDDLGRILNPDVALVINAGQAHLEALGSVQMVARAKASLIAYLRTSGAALVNQDCEDLWKAAREILPATHGFSVHDKGAEFFGRRVPDDGSGTIRVELFLRGKRLEIQWVRTEAPLLQNALAAAGAAVLLGIDDQAISRAVLSASAPRGRFQVRRQDGWMFIDDTYNANPLSMGAALARSRELAGAQPLVCVLGDMLELGGEAARAHRELGRSLARTGCVAVFYHGAHARDVLGGLSESAWSGCFQELKSPQALRDSWPEFQGLEGVALFKGSRAGAMETFLHALCSEPTS